jgi:hypothetical protein
MCIVNDKSFKFFWKSSLEVLKFTTYQKPTENQTLNLFFAKLC